MNENNVVTMCTRFTLVFLSWPNRKPYTLVYKTESEPLEPLKLINLKTFKRQTFKQEVGALIGRNDSGTLAEYCLQVDNY